MARGHHWVGVEHLLLALAGDSRGAAADCLRELGVLDAVHEAMSRYLASIDPAAPASSTVVDYEGRPYGRFVRDGDAIRLVDDEGNPLPPPPEPRH